MSNPWFRLYSEFSTDPKVQSMSEPMQRRLVMLLCLRCSEELGRLDDAEIAFALRITDEELAETKALFFRKGFVDENWCLRNWDKRQFVSDCSTDRVRAFRERLKNKGNGFGNGDETFQERHETVSETPPDTDTDTDTDTDKKTHTKVCARDYSPEFEKAWKVYPKREGDNSKSAAWKAWRARVKSGASVADLIAGAERYARYIRAKGDDGGRYVKQAATFFGPDNYWQEPYEIKRPAAASFGSPSRPQASDLDNWLKDPRAGTGYQGKVI